MSLTVRVEEKSKGIITIYSEGSIDAKTYTILDTEVDAALKKSPRLIIFNMKDVNFVSSAGVGVIMFAEKAMQLHGKNIILAEPQPQVKKVFDIVKALPAQNIFVSVKEMDNYLAEIQRKVKENEIE